MNRKNLQKEKVTAKNTALNLVIILLLATIIVSAVIGLYAWAKYRSSIDGSAEADVAKWHFELKEGTTGSGNKLLALTRTDKNTTVAEGQVAPGTNGELPIEISTEGTEVSLVYDLEVKITNYPKNMILKDSRGQKITPVVSGGTDESPRVATITVSNYVSYDTVDENRLHNETITWDWPYETGTSESEIRANDDIDTQDAGKEISVSISVTGTQIMGKPRLADLVKVGDYVNYDANSGLIQPAIYETEESLTGHSISTTFSSEDNMKWRVLSVDKESGKIELMSADPTPNALYLKGRTGYINAEDVLNDIGAVYGNGKGAIEGRSVNIEDIEKYSSYEPEKEYKNDYSSTGTVGGTREYTNGNYFVDIGDGTIEGGELNTDVGYTECLKATSENPVIAKLTYYYYTAQNYFENETIYKMLFRNVEDTENKDSFWLASRCVFLASSHCDFRVRYVSSGFVSGYELSYSLTGGANSRNVHVVPVVSLESDIQTSGKNANGEWELIVD